MSEFQTLIDDYQRLQKECSPLFNGWQPAPARLVSVQRHTETLASEALKQALEKHTDAQGWLLFSDRREILDGHTVPDLSGRVLNGELFHNGSSIRIVPTADGQWLWVAATVQNTSADAATHLATPQTRLSVEEAPGQLHYQLLWQRNTAGQMHIEDALFTGFEGASK